MGLNLRDRHYLDSLKRIESHAWVEIEGLALDSSQDFTPFDGPLFTSFTS